MKSNDNEFVKKYEINPIPKPRMLRSDKWKKRDCVLRYRSFCDQCRAQGMNVPEAGAVIYFILPMPTSWSKKKKEQMLNKPHQQKPDLDNLLKAVLDAVYGDDSGVWDLHVKKRWGHEGAIYISQVI